MKIDGDIGIEDSGIINIKVKKPKTLSGMTINMTNEKVRVGYLGINSEFSKDELPNGAFFSLISNAMDKINSNDKAHFEKDNEDFIARFDSEFGKIDVKIDKNYSIKSITIDNVGFNLILLVPLP
mgnify:FL=1